MPGEALDSSRTGDVNFSNLEDTEMQNFESRGKKLFIILNNFYSSFKKKLLTYFLRYFGKDSLSKIAEETSLLYTYMKFMYLLV